MRPRTADLFGQVPVTRPDLYAWLFVVADMDPKSPRAAEYVRTFSIIEKIAQAKTDGSFDEVYERATSDPRFKVLCAEEGQCSRGLPGVLTAVDGVVARTATRRPARSRKAKLRERSRRLREKTARREAEASMLNRLPKELPPFEVMLKDIGDPSLPALAHALQVHESTLRRWLRGQDVPRVAMLAVFWLTRWGMSLADCEAHNTAVTQASLASALQAQVDDLQERIARLTTIGEFGSANDPESPNHISRPAVAKVRRVGAARPVLAGTGGNHRRVFTGQPARLRRA